MDMVICDKQWCTGCGACINICQKDAISFVADNEGFNYPEIKQDKCVNCGKCQRVCPQNDVSGLEAFAMDKCFAVWNLDESIRKSSSSGGIFPALAELFLNNGGVVCGASFTDDYMKVHHIIIDNMDDIGLLQGSKYQQSDPEYCYRSCKEKLNKGTPVLFTGTPCQVQGLYSYLGTKHELLWTVDILCHGVPSTLVANKYLQSVEDKYKSSIKKFSYRNKNIPEGWENSCNIEILLENGKQIDGRAENLFFWKSFLSNIYLRKCCYHCEYAGKERIGDITIGDFWGIKNSIQEDLKNGISLVFVNSEKGKTLFDKANIHKEIRNVSEALPFNRTIKQPFELSGDRDKFFSDLKKSGFRRAVFNQMPLKMIKWNITIFVRNIIGDSAYNAIKRRLK